MAEQPHRPSGTGKCRKCGCKFFRPDSEDPDNPDKDKCMNTKAPNAGVCGHTRADHE